MGEGGTGTDGRVYPWGNAAEPTAALLNFNDEIGCTTQVGHYPEGASPYGVLDMAGNVWEWTSSRFEPYPYHAEDGREGLEVGGVRVLRGGSFNVHRGGVRCAARYWDYQYIGLWDNGFRVVASVR